MDNAVETKEALQTELLDEYKICQEKAVNLEANVWKTALLFGVGSIAGIITLSNENVIPQNLSPWLQIVISLIAIGVLITWLRFVQRWLSIQHVLFRRIDHIERCTQFRTNLYVGYLDGQRVKFAENLDIASIEQPFLDPIFIKDLQKHRGKYEHRGIRPMVKFVVGINIGAWIVFLLLTVASFIPNLPGNLFSAETIVTFLFFLGFVLFLFIQWRKP